MLLTDINATTDSSDWLWAPFHSADLKRVEDIGEGWDGPSWDSWMTDKGVVFGWLNGIWWVKEKKKLVFEEHFRYHAKTNIPQILAVGCIEDSWGPVQYFLFPQEQQKHWLWFDHLHTLSIKLSSRQKSSVRSLPNHWIFRSNIVQHLLHTSCYLDCCRSGFLTVWSHHSS